MESANIGELPDNPDTYGSSSDLWNSGITESDIETSAFGVYVSYWNDHNTQPRMSYVDYIEIVVYYSTSEDTTEPFWDNLVESSDPLELGNNESISIDVTDESTISNVYLEFDNVNHSMSLVSGDTYNYDDWQPTTTGLKSYTIWMIDEFNNINSTTGDITVVDTTKPNIMNIVESSDPLELGSYETIECDIYDNNTIEWVYLEFAGGNHSMGLKMGITYEYTTWLPTTTGLKSYTIWVNDSAGNINSTSSDITVIDTTDPVISNVIESDDPLDLGDTEIITCDITEVNTLDFVYIEIGDSNYSMSFVSGITYRYNEWTPISLGVKNYTIWVNDSAGNLVSFSDNITVIEPSGDEICPSYRNLVIEFNPCELGNYLKFTIEINDTNDILFVYLEFNNVNYSMNDLGDDVYYIAILPNNTGVFRYIIWFSDTENNMCSIEGNITIQDSPFLILSIVSMIFLMGLIFIAFIKLKIYIIILVIYLFSLMIGISSLEHSEMVFFPNFSVFFMMFQSFVFLLASIKKFKNKI